MWTGITKFLISTLFALSALGLANASEITLVGVELPSSIKYADWEKQESQANLTETIAKVLGMELEKEGHFIYGPSTANGFLKELSVDPSKPKQRSIENFTLLRAKTNTRFFAYIQVEKITQRNAKEGSILNNLGGTASETTVELKLELFDVEEKLMLKWPDQGNLKATFKGPFFGTTKRDEISTDPATKSAVIKNENRKRMEAVSRAVWLAIKDRLLVQLKP